MSWEPVITAPALVARAEAVIARTGRLFAAQLAETAPSPPRLRRFLTRTGGFDGVPAVALLHAYLALERGDEGDLDATVAWLNRAAETIEVDDEVRPWLGTGLAGTAWIRAHVLARLAEPDTDDGDDPVAELLADLVDQVRAPDAELVTGLAGLGACHLEALPSPAAARGLAAVLARLRGGADELPTGLAWRKALPALSAEERRDHPEGLYDLGIPHGVPGVIGFLAAVCESPRPSDAVRADARELLEGAVSWLVAQQAPCGASVYPYLVDPRTGPIPAESRLAWCYGDLAVAAPLLHAARALRRSDWAEHATALALGAAARPAETAGVHDGMICHGAAGVAHLFDRLHQATREPALRDAAVRWFATTLDLDDPGFGPTGYHCPVREPQDADETDVHVVDTESYGLVVGICGVALALLAGLGRVAPDWDRVLALGVPPEARRGG